MDHGSNHYNLHQITLDREGEADPVSHRVEALNLESVKSLQLSDKNINSPLNKCSEYLNARFTTEGV